MSACKLVPVQGGQGGESEERRPLKVGRWQALTDKQLAYKACPKMPKMNGFLAPSSTCLLEA